MCATPRKQNDAQPDLNARTDTERAMRGLILVAVGAASLAAGGFIALRRAHVERARSGRVTVPTVIAAFVANGCGSFGTVGLACLIVVRAHLT